MNNEDQTTTPKRGAPEGNQNAAKDETLDTVLSFKCRGVEKSAWVRAAGGEKLAAWVRRTLNEAAGD